jgi:beta-glucosidase
MEVALKDKIGALIREMTLEEKAALCTGCGMWRTAAIPRLGIPAIVMNDGTNGVRNDKEQVKASVEELRESELAVREGEVDHFFAQTDFIDLNQDSVLLARYRPATCVPTGSAIACSWDVDLIKAVGKALGEECREFGVDLLLAPGVNIRRTPLGGRGYEYYSEDPLVAGEMGAAFVSGVQGEGVGACVKHFACNNSEYQRTVMSSDVDERALWEIYLRTFERIIKKASPWALMSSYNKLNGAQASQNRYLLTEALREKMGYEGTVISDWWGVKDRVEAARAGNDLEMPENPNNRGLLVQAVKEGRLEESVLDRLCSNVLKLVFTAKEGEKRPSRADFMSHHQLARRAAAESMVLLRNEDSLLPIDPERVSSIAVLGGMAMHPRYQGAGCATIHPTFMSIPLEEIRRRAGEGVVVRYAEGYTPEDETGEEILRNARSVAEKSDIAIVFAGLAIAADTEGSDRRDLEIAEGHKKLIEEVCSVQKNVVVVLSNGDAVTMDPWIGKVGAVIDQFYSGQAGGAAVCDLLFGDVNPSGKLTVTFPRRLEDAPAFLHYPGEAGRHLYSEGIYAGYRYFDKRKIEPLFSFGFGLSYTSFDYSKLKLRSAELGEGEALEFSLSLTNAGGRDGKEVVQAYVTPKSPKLARPPRELKAFAKVAIKAGETIEVSMAIPYADLAYWDPEAHCWAVDSCEYELAVGKSSRDILLRGSFRVTAGKAGFAILRLDSVHADLFANPRAKELYVEYLYKKGILTEANGRKVLAVMQSSFVGIYNHLTGLLYQTIPRSEVQELLDKINAETAAAEGARQRR